MDYYKNLDLADIKYFCEIYQVEKIEEWRFIPGYENLYSASDLGRIKSLFYRGRKGHGILQQSNSHGYLQVNLCKDGVKKSHVVHIAVCMAFLGHVPCGVTRVVDHKFQNTKDNRLIMLHVVTQRTNTNQKHLNSSKDWSGDLLAAGYKGREGMLSAFAQGNIFAGTISDRTSAENLVNRLEKQGQLRDNIIYGTTQFCFAIDSFLSTQSSATGLSYGAFQNNKQMALDLSFQGYTIGGWEFQYSRLQYLTEPTAQGAITGINKVNGFLIPSASQSVMDPMVGTPSVKPMIHVRNRAYGSLNRDYEMVVRDWKSGTSLTDTVTTEWQSEQAIVVIARNNCVLFKG